MVVGIAPRVMNDWIQVAAILRSDNPYHLLSSAVGDLVGIANLVQLESVLIAFMGDEGSRALSRMADAASLSSSPTDVSARLGDLLQHMLQGQLLNGLSLAKRFIGDCTRATYKGFLSMVFSVLIVWDLPALTRGIQSLAKSRLSFAYHELAGPIRQFGKVVGQSLEVTALIALVNCVLITLGLGLLGVSGIGFFSVLTFVASFIPVLGIGVATLPPVVVALTENGMMKALQVVGMVVGVHLLEVRFLTLTLTTQT